MIFSFRDHGADRLLPFVGNEVFRVWGWKLQSGKDIVVEAIDSRRLSFNLNKIGNRLSGRGARHHDPEGTRVAMRYPACAPQRRLEAIRIRQTADDIVYGSDVSHFSDGDTHELRTCRPNVVAQIRIR